MSISRCFFEEGRSDSESLFLDLLYRRGGQGGGHRQAHLRHRLAGVGHDVEDKDIERMITSVRQELL